MSLKFNDEKVVFKYQCSKCKTKYYGKYGVIEANSGTRLDGVCNCSTRDEIGWLIDIKTGQKISLKRTQSLIEDNINQLKLF